MECMARRVDPYKDFRFRVLLGDVVVGGFQEVQAVTKLSGLNKSTDVTLKRGVIGAASLRDWLNRARKRTVSIELQATHARLTLGGTTIVKHDAPPLNGTGNDVPIEELVLTADRLEFTSRQL
jgi:hypothetical protein